MTSSEVRVLSTDSIYSGRVFAVVEQAIQLPSGLRQDLAVVRHPGAVAISAQDERGRLLVVRQYRHALEEWTLEIPAGRLEADEAPADAALRELEEETGYRARNCVPLRTIAPAPGFCSERIHLFAATGLTPAGDSALQCDADEELEVLWVTPEELNRSTQDAKSLLAAALAGSLLENDT